MKKFFTATKYLWFGGIMGVLHQILSDLPSVRYQGNIILNFSEIMSGIAIYAAIILLVIKRDVPPKQQFRDLLLFFIGLDFFYYLYTFFIRAFLFMTDPANDNALHDSLTTYEISDFIYWTSIGLAAAVWAFAATKLRNMGKKKLYIVMLLPLFAVMAWQLCVAIFGIIMFFITRGENMGSLHFDCYTLSALTSLVSLIVCLYQFLKSHLLRKTTHKKRKYASDRCV